MLGSFFDVVIFFALILLGLILSLIFPLLNGIRKLSSYVPISILISELVFIQMAPNPDLGHHLHFLLNKRNLDSIYNLSKKSHVYQITDMLRYHKNLNKASLSDNNQYTTEEQIKEAFGQYLTRERLNIKQVSEIRQRLHRSDVISMTRTENFFVLTMDGMIDNEYGYVKTEGIKLKIGDTLPPYDFQVIRVIDLGNGWYFFYST